MHKLTATFILNKIPVPVGEVVQGELPKEMIFTSRVIPNSFEVNGQEYNIDINTDYTDEILTNAGLNGCEAVSIETISKNQDQQQALDNFMQELEIICDSVAFKMQAGIYIRELKVQTLNNENVAEGEGLLFPFPHGCQPEKFINALQFGQFGEINPIPESKYFKLDKETLAILKWYRKALVAPFEIDRFIFFFIVCEILCKRNQTRVTQFYRNSCGHEIEKCPICQTSTQKIVNGPSIKLFLEKECNVSADIAKQIWNHRQILHGANDAFKPKNNSSTLIVELQAAITDQIKKILDIPQGNAPIINKDIPIIRQMAFTTTV